MSSRWVALAAAGAVAPLLLGCATSDEPDESRDVSATPSPESPTSEAPTHFVIAPGGGEGGQQALLEGELRLDDGCLVVLQERGNGRVKAVVPAFLDTMSPRWDARSRTLTVGDREYAAGSRVSFGGGLATRARVADDLAVPEKCAGRGPYFVVQQLIDWDEVD